MEVGDRAEIPAPVVGIVHGRSRELPRASEPGVRCQVRPARGALLGPDDVLPSAVAEEAMISARDELRPVVERHPERGLDRAPVGTNLCPHVPPVGAALLGAVDRVPDLEVGERLRPSVGHEDRRVSRHAVDARVAAPPVGVDRPVERQVAARDVVDDRLGLDLDELDAAEVRRVEGAPAQLEQPLAARSRLSHPRIIEHVFDGA
jgi:hypothetical protein